MNRLRTLALSSFALFAGSLGAKTACEVLPIDDAVVVLSQNAQQRDLGTAGCAYEIATPYLLLRATPPEPMGTSFAQLKKAFKEKGATVKDEPGIGSASFSVATKDLQAIYVIQGSTEFTIELSNPGSSTPLPDLMNKMRDVAKRAAARL